MTPSLCPSCSKPLAPGEAAPSPVPGVFPVLCEGCAEAATSATIYWIDPEGECREVPAVLVPGSCRYAVSTDGRSQAAGPDAIPAMGH